MLAKQRKSGIMFIDNTSEDNTSEDNTSEDNTSEDNTSEDNTSEEKGNSMYSGGEKYGN